LATRAEIPPHLFVVFGATGDLMRRKLLPALARLGSRGALRQSVVLGVGRSGWDDARFRTWAHEALEATGLGGEALGRWPEACLFFHSIGPGRPEDYGALRARIEALEREFELPGNRVFYLALPPHAFAPTIEGLGRSGLHRGSGWVRLVIEKPFGLDLTSAQDLNARIHAHFDEQQVYRIDHYLGKETVQNLLTFRFANPIFESLWNRDRVDHVQITVAETIGIEGRLDYYDHVGALRDMVQNHLTQLLTLVAMEPPAAFEPEAIRNEKVKVLRSVEPIRREDAVFGQYERGWVGGREVPGYREEIGAPSRTETFVALRLEIANWRWQGVPFYLRTGKRMERRVSQVVVRFRPAPVALFGPDCRAEPNALVVTIQPDEGFDLYFSVKSPGQPIRFATERLHFRYAEAFGPLPDAYETLLPDILAGDQSLFVRADEVEEAWRLYTPLLENPPEVHPYPAGTWGPAAADGLLRREGRGWFPA
jgi:glucose-6-phosphate 1-dehydrogenase